jgi:hypothetical protein
MRIATNLAGLAEVSFRRLSRLDLLAASITARDPKPNRVGVVGHSEIGWIDPCEILS